MPKLARGSDTPVATTAQTPRRAAVRHPPCRCAEPGGDRQRLAAAPCAPSSLGSCDIKIMLFTTLVKYRPVTPPRDHPVQLEGTFCVQGVSAPCRADTWAG